MKNFDILICVNDKYSLPVHVCDTIEEATEWIGCSKSALYKSLHIHGIMQAKGYTVELVKRQVVSSNKPIKKVSLY